MDPITIAAIGQGVLGTAQAIQGGIQARRAQQAIRELQKNAPDIVVPSALRQLAGEPIAEDYIEAQEMGAQRRTAQSIDALGKGGSRALAGALPQVMESERIGEQQRAGQYEQARKTALGNLANAEQRNMQLRLQQYFADLNAARGSLEAGQQNVAAGVGGLGSGLSAGLGRLGSDEDGQNDQMNTLIELLKNQKKSTVSTPSFDPPEMTPEQERDFNLENDPMTYKDGGMLKTKGVFSHRKNPKYLVDGKSGKVEAELTGSETVFNEADSKKMESMANKGEGKKLAKFMKGKYKAFNSNRRK